MSQPGNSQKDGSADAIAATAIITIVVVGLTMWLGWMPA